MHHRSVVALKLCLCVITFAVMLDKFVSGQLVYSLPWYKHSRTESTLTKLTFNYDLTIVNHSLCKTSVVFASETAIPVATLAHNPQSTTVTSTTAATNAQKITVGNANIRDGLQRLATQTVTVKQGDSVQRIAVPSFAQVVQTSTGRHIILTSNQQNTNTGLSQECSYPTHIICVPYSK